MKMIPERFEIINELCGKAQGIGQISGQLFAVGYFGGRNPTKSRRWLRRWLFCVKDRALSLLLGRLDGRQKVCSTIDGGFS